MVRGDVRSKEVIEKTEAVRQQLTCHELYRQSDQATKNRLEGGKRRRNAGGQSREMESRGEVEREFPTSYFFSLPGV